MRNLKRALSLALASIMVLGMMVVGAGAVSYDDLSDKDKIVNQEAVQMLVELGVINGKDDGTYDPEGIVTRAEMAKMICVVLNGGKDPNLGTTVTNSYTDTVGNWAAGYIEYCTQLNIVAGDGTGKFNPNDTVTGSEAAKMLLVALGYKSEVEGFTGSNWAIAVNVRANQKGLYKDLSINANEGLTRDSAAQMVYNALDADVVSYEYTLVTNGSAVSSSPTLKDDSNKTLLEDKFNAVKVEGVVIANEFADLKSGASKGSSLDEGKTELRITNGGANEDQNEYVGDKTFTVDSKMEDLGRSVVVYVKKNSNSSKAEVLGSVIASGDNKVVVDSSGDSINAVADDNKLDIDTKTTMIANNYAGMTSISSSEAGKDRTAGVEKILIDTDDDGTVDYVLVNTYYFGKVTTYTTSGDGSIAIDVGAVQSAVGKNVTKLTADDKSDVTGFDDVSKGDYVLAQYIGGKLLVEAADSVTGTLEAYKDDPATKVTVDGTDYNTSFVTGYVGGDDDIRQANTDAKDTVKNEATFYLDKNGRVAAMGEADANAGKYAMVLAVGQNIEDKVKVALADGTVATYNINSNGVKKSALNIGQVYAYSINSSNEIKLTRADIAYQEKANAAFEKGKITVKSDGGTRYATKSTAFFYVTDSDGKIITDERATASIDSDYVDTYTSYEKAPDLDSGATATVYTKTVGNDTRVVAVVFAGADLVSANNEDNLYVSKIISTDGDDTKIEAFVNGSDELKTITVSGTDVVRRSTYTYAINSDGTYDLKKGFTKDNWTVSNVTGRNFVVNGVAYRITSDTVIVDDSKYLDAPSATLGTGGTISKGDNIIGLVVNGDNDALMVAIRNEKTGGGSSSGTGDDATATTSISRTGNLTVNLKADKAAYAADNAVITFGFDVMIDGEFDHHMTKAGDPGATTARYTDTGYDQDWDVTIENITLSYSAVKVQYVDDKGNDVSSYLSKAPEAMTTDSGSATTLVFAVKNTYTYNVGDVKYSTTGLNANVTNTNVAAAGTDTTVSATYATGNDYVKVVIKGLGDAKDLYSVTNNMDTAKKLSTWGVTGTDKDTELTLTITTTPLTALASGAEVKGTVALGSAPANTDVYGYRVVCDKLGLDEILHDANTANWSFRIDSNVTIDSSDFEVTPVANLKVTGHTWNAGEVVITFNKDIKVTTGSGAVPTVGAASSGKSFEITNTAGTGGDSANWTISVDGNDVTITAGSGNFKATDVVTAMTGLEAADGEVTTADMAITLS